VWERESMVESDRVSVGIQGVCICRALSYPADVLVHLPNSMMAGPLWPRCTRISLSSIRNSTERCWEFLHTTASSRQLPPTFQFQDLNSLNTIVTQLGLCMHTVQSGSCPPLPTPYRNDCSENKISELSPICLWENLTSLDLR
jgi:hypothetical protein